MDLLWFRPQHSGGIGTHARGLLKGLAEVGSENQYFLYLSSDVSETFSFLPGNFNCREICRAVKSGLNGRLLQQVYLPRRLALDKIDVLHSPANTISLTVSCPTVVTIHDLTLSYLNRYALSARERLAAVKARLLSALVNRSARRADAIITDSEFSRKTIIERLGIPTDRIRVIHSAVNSDKPSAARDWPAIAARLGIVGDYIVAFSNQFLHKNIESLVKAFSRIERDSSLHLVVVGHPPKDGGRLLRTIRELSLRRNVILTGFLSDGDLQAVLAHSRLLAFPSLSEGFGLPVLEAMTVGVPVACSDATALPEVAGNAAVYFDPHSVEGMAAALQRVLNDEALRRQLIAAGYENVKRFSWSKHARETLNVYRSVASAAG